jgi:hypothetical protein
LHHKFRAIRDAFADLFALVACSKPEWLG